MKTALIISDTHGAKAPIAAVLSRCAHADMIIHLGDYSRDANHIRTLTDKPVYAVRGNCDLSASAEAEITLVIEGVRVLALHGHRQNVKSSLLGLGLHAQEKDVDLVLFGHTHIPAEQQFHGITMYNPGSLGEPRFKNATFGVLTAEDGAFRLTTMRL